MSGFEKTFLEIITAFGFSQLKDWVMVVTFVFFVGNTIGGMISSVFVIYSSALHPPKLKTRISFRLFIIWELMLAMSAAYYQAFMAETVTIAHIIYWISALLISPLLAVIGAQLMNIAFIAKIHAKRKAYHDRARKKRHDRTETMEEEHARLARLGSASVKGRPG